MQRIKRQKIRNISSFLIGWVLNLLSCCRMKYENCEEWLDGGEVTS